ncbi:hypothetical protein KBB96_10670 [Luteolibacter ambystomatis]|uniref:Glycosyl hydrolase family 76 n=1 Tax=Luteolibacter ambystomatis TaxID=2824561 RepID=A0A975IXQ6_9BACT|nr:glycoside hydrolase family 76 protein [Luteolibacter ambystomatis]QUE49334.1 hypothetical protein KBB96_10670 [Luteolibacter ambystomatis]
MKYPEPISRRNSLKTIGLGWMALQCPTLLQAQTKQPAPSRAREVTDWLDRYWDDKREIYMDKADKKNPTAIWAGGILFSTLVAAARHDKQRFQPMMNHYFKGLEAYWDPKVKIPGYEPLPTAGNGNDKYYDDNAWMVLTFLEAYEQTGEAKYLRRAKETHDFVLSGWDDQLGGGIWWHERHNDDAKNTCVNAPAALSCFRLSKFSDPKTAEKLIAQGKKIVEWTVKTLQSEDGLFMDHIKVSTGKISRARLTYNTALMLRCFLWLHSYTNDPAHLAEAKRVAKAADSFLDGNGVYRDLQKWSHLMVEADIEMYRHTKDDYYLNRAKKTCTAHYDSWKSAPKPEVIDNASCARELWLLEDLDSPAAVRFWQNSDNPRKS